MPRHLQSTCSVCLPWLWKGCFWWERQPCFIGRAIALRMRHYSGGGLLLSLAIWWLVTPVLGMMHLAALPAAVILLFQSLKSTRPALYRWGVYLFAALYILGLAGFLYGLSSPELYGLHIWLAEVAYKVGMTVFMLILTLPLFALAADQGDDLV